MNLPDPQAPKAFENDLEFSYKRLRMLTQASAVSVLILTGTVFVFLYRQVVLVRRQTAELSKYISDVERSGVPEFFEQVRGKFNEFRKQNPDFNPIYAKYFGTNEPVARPVAVTNIPPGAAKAGR